MKLGEALRRLRIDPYILAILAMVGVATLLPARGAIAVDLGWATKIVIAALFFLHGARLSREAVIAGVSHWRLHLIVLGATFALFPLLGLATALLPTSILPASLAAGVVFLCCLPSTVQSSIAFTSIARGNVAAAVCAASLSNLVGVVVTPILVAVLLRAHSGGFSWSAAEAIVLQLLLPFAAGQVSRIWIAKWAQRNRTILSLFDRGSILLVVYTAFSEAVVHGIWGQVTVFQLLLLALLCSALLAVVLAVTAYGSRAMGFDKADEITIMFCGSKKSLASGVPMAGILFPAATVGLLVLPLMLFHQIQLMVCAYLATRYSGRPAETLSEAVMADLDIGAMSDTDPSKPLAGRIALVTGASRGIGRACALALAQAGAHVIATARAQGGLEELDDEIRALTGERATLVPLDLAQGDGLDQLGLAIHQRHARLDILVHAGAMLGGLWPVSHMDPPQWDRLIATNLTAAYRLIRSMEPLLRQSQAGRAIFLTTGRAARPRAFWGGYAASKAGLEALVRCWADEIEHTAIRAILLDPNVMRTKMRAEAYPGEDPATLPEPSEIGPMIVELALSNPGLPAETVKFNDWKAARGQTV